MNKRASSQASWSILSEGVSSSRVQAHILRSFCNQIKDTLENCDDELREEIYQQFGDVLNGIPQALSRLERNLDMTNYALIKMGEGFYRQRLTHTDREKVDLASKYNQDPVKKVALTYLKGK